jgi:PKD repeat protein
MHAAERHRAARERAPDRASPSRRPLHPPSVRARLRPRSRGQALVEFALILPVFLLLLVIAVDFGRLFYTDVQIHNAAREAAAVAIYAPTNTTQIASHATAEKDGQGQRGDVENAITVTTSCADSTPAHNPISCSLAQGGTGSGYTVTVNVNQRFVFLTPLISSIFGSSLQINASATAAVLGYAGGTGGTNPGTCSLPSASFVFAFTGSRTIFADPSASTPNSGVCNISGYNWDWGDGNLEVGTATGSSHTFAASDPGPWQVKLTVTNQAGENSQTRTVTIVVVTPPPTCAKPTPNFFIQSKTGQGNKTYNYKDSSTVADPVNCPISDWLWTFNDLGGLQSNAQNPSATYASGGNHSVTLRVTNAGGSNSITLNL